MNQKQTENLKTFLKEKVSQMNSFKFLKYGIENDLDQKILKEENFTFLSKKTKLNLNKKEEKIIISDLKENIFRKRLKQKLNMLGKHISF